MIKKLEYSYHRVHTPRRIAIYSYLALLKQKCKEGDRNESMLYSYETHGHWVHTVYIVNTVQATIECSDLGYTYV